MIAVKNGERSGGGHADEQNCRIACSLANQRAECAQLVEEFVFAGKLQVPAQSLDDLRQIETATSYTAPLRAGEEADAGKIRSTLRLGLFPLLATAAAIEYRITGSDKGIW